MDDIISNIKKECYDHIFIYGAGDYAKYVEQQLKVLEIYAFLVSSMVACGDSENDNILEYKKGIITDNDVVIIGVINQQYKKEIIDNLKQVRNVIEIKEDYYFIDRASKVAEGRQMGFFSDYKHLQALGEAEGTDKAGLWHDYCNKYEFFLKEFKNKSFAFVELGVFKGASIRMWRKYFAQARIIGIDIDSSCIQYATNGIEILIGDLGTKEMIYEVNKLQPAIIVDDASHKWSHQINALFELFPLMPHGGIYIIEDISTSFIPTAASYGDTDISTYEIIEKISEGVVGNSIKDVYSNRIENYWDSIKVIIEQTEMVINISDSVILIKR